MNFLETFETMKTFKHIRVLSTLFASKQLFCKRNVEQTVGPRSQVNASVN